MEVLFGLLTDGALIGGVLIILLSFSSRFSPRRKPMLLGGAVLVLLSLVFTDWEGVREAAESGYEAGVEAASPRE
jgi:hypothetical protein